MRLRFAAAVAAALTVAPVHAATFYYASEVYTYSNYAGGVVPTYTTGVLEVDETALPEGQSLNNLSIDAFYGDRPDYLSNFITGFRFENQREVLADSAGFPSLPVVGLNFNAGEITSWNLATDGFEPSQTYRTSGNSDRTFDRKDDQVNGSQHEGFRADGASWFTDKVRWLGKLADNAVKAMTNPPSNVCRG